MKNKITLIILQCCPIAAHCNAITYAITQCMAIIKIRTTIILCLCSSIVCNKNNNKKKEQFFLKTMEKRKKEKPKIN
jgi:hypothetical protein